MSDSTDVTDPRTEKNYFEQYGDAMRPTTIVGSLLVFNKFGEFKTGQDKDIDIPIGTHLYRYFNLEIERPALPRVEAWYARLQERSAYHAHVMVPFDELYGRLDP